MRLGARVMLLAAALEGSAYAQTVDIVDQRVAVDLTGSSPRIELTVDVAGDTSSPEMVVAKPSVPILEATVDGEPLEVSPNPMSPDQSIVLKWTSPLTTEQGATLHLTLEGEFDCRSPYASSLTACEVGPELTYLVPHWGGVVWYLVNLQGQDGFQASVSVTVPAGQWAASAEGLPEINQNPDTTTFTYHHDHTVDALWFYAGAVQRVTSDQGVFAEGLYATSTPAKSDAVQRGVDLASQLAGTYAGMHAVEPLDQVRIIVVPPTFQWGGVGFLGTVLLPASAFSQDESYLRQAVAHELAHTYWGNIASASAHDPALKFLHESMAEYTAWRGLGEVFGDDYRTAGSRMNAVWYMFGRPGDQDVAVLDPAVSSSPVMVHAVYHKGSTALRTFEEAASTESWKDGLSSLLQVGYAGLSVPSFIESLEDAGFDQCSAYVDQWMRREGYPHLVASVDVEDAAGGSQVTVAVDTDWPHAFALPVVLHMADGSTVEEKITVGAGTVETVIQTPTRPALVQVDPRWTSVRLVEPSIAGDVTLDGQVDAADLIEVALHQGGRIPSARRVDGGYDPLFDVDGSGEVDDEDLTVVHEAAGK